MIRDKNLLRFGINFPSMINIVLFCILLSVIVFFISNSDIRYRSKDITDLFIIFIATVIPTIISWYCALLLYIEKHIKLLKFHPYAAAFFLSFSFYVQTTRWLFHLRFADYYNPTFFLLLIIILIFLIDIVIFHYIKKFRLSKEMRTSGDLRQKNEKDTPKKDESLHSEMPIEILGLGQKPSDRATKSLLYRANSAERISQFSMVIMIVLVFVGGGSSFGFWVKDRLEIMQTLENERNKLVNLKEGLSGKGYYDQMYSSFRTRSYDVHFYEEIETSFNSFVNFLETTTDFYKIIDESKLKSYENLKNSFKSAKESYLQKIDAVLLSIKNNLSDIYGNKNEYEKVFEDVKKSSQTSWADIAARGTIALLTLFLVQIFFSVYKFNRQLSSSLSAKAEAIEMIASDKDSEQLLNKELISIVKQHLPGFGKEPKTLLHEAIDLAGNLKEHVQIKKI